MVVIVILFLLLLQVLLNMQAWIASEDDLLAGVQFIVSLIVCVLYIAWEAVRT